MLTKPALELGAKLAAVANNFSSSLRYKQHFKKPPTKNLRTSVGVNAKSIIFFLLFILPLINYAQTTISCSGVTEFRESFGSTNATLPTATSTASPNYTGATPACTNGNIVSMSSAVTGGGSIITADVSIDGDVGSHFLYHVTGCATTAGDAAWQNAGVINVIAGETYTFSYYGFSTSATTRPVLSQVVVPATGSITVIATNYTTLNEAGWIKNSIVFTPSASTSVTLRINNATTATASNNFALDNIVLSATPPTPLPIASVIANNCPGTTYNLSSLNPAAMPGFTYQWHTVASNPSAGTLVSTPATAAGAGPFYLYAVSASGCYSAASTPVTAIAYNCNQTISCGGTTIFREDFGSISALLPYGLSTASPNYTGATPACTNGKILSTTVDEVGAGANIITADVSIDGDVGDHFLFHQTGCTSTAGDAAWQNAGVINVIGGQTYTFSYYGQSTSATTRPVLSQVVVPATGTITVHSTNYTTLNEAGWIKNSIVFTPSASTSVTLRINNATTAIASNNFALDNIALIIDKTAPDLLVTTIVNNCPATTFELTSLTPAAVGGTTYEWHTVASNPSAGTLVATPAAAAGAGPFFLYSAIGPGCYSLPTKVTALPMPCTPLCPGSEVSSTLPLRTALTSGSVTNNGVTVTFTKGLAGTAGGGTGPAHGNNVASGTFTSIHYNSFDMDMNVTGNELNRFDTLRNYVVSSFKFSRPVILNTPFRIEDIDYDHTSSNNEYIDMAGIVLEINGVYYLPPTARPATNGAGPITPWGIRVGEITVGNNPTTGMPNLLALDRLPVYYTTTPINGSTKLDATAGDPKYGVEWDLSKIAVDAIHVIYFNGVNSNQPAGQTLVILGEQTAYLTCPVVTVSGTIYNDGNAGTISGTGLGNPEATPLYATLLDGAGKVIQTVLIASNGTYSLMNVTPRDYTLQIGSVNETSNIGNLPSAPNLPANWNFTADGSFGNTGDLTPNGSQDISVSNAGVTTVDFGINKKPVAMNVTVPTQTNPGGTGTVVVPALSISDLESTPTIITIPTLPDLTTEGILYYNSMPVVAGVPIINYNPALLTFDPVNSATIVSFAYTTTDAAGVVSDPATVSMEFTAALPLHLISFTAEKNDNGNLLKWTTSNETSFSGFEVERAFNNSTVFEKITTVNGGASNYSFLDKTIPKGTCLYRLKMVDIDGAYTYSPIIKININGNAGGFTIYPNPARAVVNIMIADNFIGQPATIKLLASDGSVVHSQAIRVLGNKATIPASKLAAGTYFVNIVVGNATVFTRAVIIN